MIYLFRYNFALPRKLIKSDNIIKQKYMYVPPRRTTVINNYALYIIAL